MRQARVPVWEAQDQPACPALTHQIGEDVVVPDAILFQLHDLKDKMGGYSSVTQTATVTKAVSTGHLQHAFPVLSTQDYI